MLGILKRLFDRAFTREQDSIPFPTIFERFQNMLLTDHHRVMELMADLGEKSCGDFIFDRKYLQDSVRDLQDIPASNGKRAESDRIQSLHGALFHAGSSSPRGDRAFKPVKNVECSVRGFSQGCACGQS